MLARSSGSSMPGHSSSSLRRCRSSWPARLKRQSMCCGISSPKGVRLSCGSANIRSARDTDGHKTDTGFHVRVLQCNIMCSMSYVKLLNLSQKKKALYPGWKNALRNRQRTLANSNRVTARLRTSYLVEGPLTNGLPASKKRSSRPTSRVMPMRTAVLMCAVSRTAVPSQSGPLAHRSTPSKRWSMSNAAASRPGPLAKSVSLSVLRSRFIRLMPSRGSMARNSTPAPTPGSSAVTLSMYDVP